MHFRFPHIDNFSFWLGIILASLSLWIFSMLRPAIRHMRETAKVKKEENRERIHSSSAVEERYRQNVLKQAQGMHLASPLFSLDEIIEPPTLLAPPPRVEPGAPLLSEDIVEATVPYIPAW